jgi:predicted enzyme related to lactoylglutathione lyase
VLIWTESARFPAMRQFYVDTLGLPPHSDRQGFVNFEWGSTRLTIGIHDQVQGLARDPLRLMINLAVDDIDKLHQRLVAAGTVCMRQPGPEPWGGRVATYSDPDGNIVQLLTV